MSTQTVGRALYPDQKVSVTFQPEDARGNPAPIEKGTLEHFIDVSPPAIAEWTVEEDGTVTIHANELGFGTVTITSTADADLGEGVRNVVAQSIIELKVLPREAVDAEHAISEAIDE